MLRKNKVLFTFVLSAAVLASAAFFFLGQDRVAEADLQKSWLTLDVNEMKQMQQIAAGENRPLNLEVVRVENDIAVVRATEDQIAQISEHSHEEFHKCGGFIAHETEADALTVIANFANADSNQSFVEYTITNGATVQPLINGMVASNIVQTISTLSAFSTRYYNSPTGVQSATWIKNNWTTLAQGRSDVSVQFFTHTFQQPSVILTITGTAQPNEVIVLGAHQDSIRSGCADSTTCQTLVSPGADDDASGIASLTEVIRIAMASNYRPAKTVKFMAFAGEERGLLGSAAIATNFQTNAVNVIGMLQLDMTNYKGSTASDITIFTDFTNAAQNQFLRNLIAAYLPTLVTNNSTCGYGCSDHASFHNRGFPASFPHESAFNVSNPRIHTANDTLANTDTTGAHALKFSKLAAAYMAELAKGSLVVVQPANAKRADFDGDGRTDFSVFRPVDGTWYINQSQSNALRGERFGAATDRITPGDYDGDGKTDVAVYRPSNGTWYVIKSQNSAFSGVNFGASDDTPVAADYDGDGKTDYGVFRPSNGTWYVARSSDSQFAAAQFGAGDDTPVAGDYDGDGKSDYAVYRPSNGTWYLLRSTAGFTGVPYGIATDKPVAADYDGDRKTDIAVYRDGTWHLLRSTEGVTSVQFGAATDVPSAGDYDGDGKSDVAVYRGGTWYVLQSTAGFTSRQFGATEDKPVPAAY